MKSEQKEKEKCRPFLLVLCHVVISYSSSSVTSLPIPSIPACSSLCLIDLANTIFTLELESLLDPLLIHVAALRLLLLVESLPFRGSSGEDEEGHNRTPLSAI